MFSSTAEYALRAAVYLATHTTGLRSSAEIAAATQVPPKYISKVLQDLTEAGIFVSRRGPSGGFRLARDAADISVLEVVNAVDPIRRITACPLGLPAHAKRLCRLHRTIDGAIALVQEALAGAPLSQMCETWGPPPILPTVRGQAIPEARQARKPRRARP